MAGSWNHAVTKNYKLLNNENFCDMIENLGDAYEMAEEMYGMIWFLARTLTERTNTTDTINPTRDQIMDTIRQAIANYKDGIAEGGVQRSR